MTHAEYVKAYDQYIAHCEAGGHVWYSFPEWKSMYMGRHQKILH